MTHPDLLMLLLADARLPVAGHTQSGTLEGALGHGLDPAAIPDYLSARLRSVTLVEAGTALAARSLVSQDGAGADLASVEAAWAARTASPALREASRGQGRTLLRLAERLWSEAPGVKAVGALPRWPGRAVVLGALAADLALPAPALARLVGYDDLQTVCAAALKLTPLDPVTVTGWVHAALSEVDRLVAAVAQVRSPEEIPATGSPQIEAWAQAHAHTTRRLFRA